MRKGVPMLRKAISLTLVLGATAANAEIVPISPVDGEKVMVHLGNIAALTGESVKTDPVKGTLCAGSAGAEFWGREYEKGWELA